MDKISREKWVFPRISSALGLCNYFLLIEYSLPEKLRSLIRARKLRKIKGKKFLIYPQSWERSKIHKS